jgi:hypothetical protein
MRCLAIAHPGCRQLFCQTVQEPKYCGDDGQHKLDLSPDRLEIEITESCLFPNHDGMGRSSPGVHCTPSLFRVDDAQILSHPIGP